MEQLSGLGHWALDWVLPLYRDASFAYAVAALMGLIATAIAIAATVQHLLVAGAIKQRRRVVSATLTMRTVTSVPGAADAAEMDFFDRFSSVDDVLSQPGLGAADLVYGWRRYRKTLDFSAAPPVRSAARPQAFLFDSVRPPQWLEFSAALFVGFGLLATFVGLVAALSFASAGMEAGQVTAMQSAVRDLLSAASSKFVTSIAGVGLSLVLRLLDKVLSDDLRVHLEGLCRDLEAGIRVDGGQLQAPEAAAGKRGALSYG